ncbi:hypothetical protein [Methylorubrum aminovorans]
MRQALDPANATLQAPRKAVAELMVNKHFTHDASGKTGKILLSSSIVPCTVLERSDTSAKVRVLAAASLPERLNVEIDGQAREAHVAVRKQGPLGLDLWLDLKVLEISDAA